MNDINKVQCFYNCNYNQGCHDGQSKFVWGFGVFDLSANAVPLKEQIIKKSKLIDHEVFNLNLTSFTPFHDAVFDRVDEDE